MVTIWQLFYVVGSPFIKIRICMTLIRVATQRWYTYPLYAVCGLSVAMTLMAFIAVFIQCAPFEASWTGQGKCISVEGYHHSHIHLFSRQYFRELDCGDNAGLHFVASLTSQEVEAPVFGYLRTGRPVSIPRVSITCYHPMVRTKTKTTSPPIATIIRMPYVPGYAAKTGKLRKCRPLPVPSLCCTLTRGVIAYRHDRVHHPLDSC